MPLIDKLTPEQEALIPVYREKWRKIGLSTEPIDREKVALAVKYFYAAISLSEPEIIFFARPDVVLETFCSSEKERVLVKIGGYQIWRHLQTQIDSDGESTLWLYLVEELANKLVHGLQIQLLNNLINNWLIIENTFAAVVSLILLSRSSLFDFCISVLNCDCDRESWFMYQLLIKNSGWILPLEKGCYVCDRPRILSFDNQQRLHAEGSPAIQFADGFSVYAYHGVRLPEKYGKVHLSQWRSEWLLTEENAELKRVLIQGIGYAKICQELQAIELDSWREYSLLKIDNDIDVEPIYMLKMTCPSTGYIHALRVPPDMQTAREAIKWVNWGIDPEEFGVQT